MRRCHAKRKAEARAHLAGKDDRLARVAPLAEMVEDWREYLAAGSPAETGDILRGHERTGRPLGDDGFIDRLEGMLGRALRKLRSGPRRFKGRERAG